ncbi:MAG: hypothetical protein A3K19_18750 [Lentisphaerae bacterium RIFOXYB12_FULL_65_16]|nr:MAG: hypothetical protein A3K18_26200 [Lentisphaerae bacterium RIFOXYA12_64_32]OGV92463.1 MAG: hypothetical protein A3K19_18750 [Lentisphaerae bacterium RIFOXYB12_FULL_65_16]
MTDFAATAEVLTAILAKADEMLSSAERAVEARAHGDAASRAYYAVFHALSAVLATRGLSYSSHSQTLGAFNREFVKTGAFAPETSRQLQRLFEDRQIADYDWKRHVDQDTARRDVADAAALVAGCKRFIREQPGSST